MQEKLDPSCRNKGSTCEYSSENSLAYEVLGAPCDIDESDPT